MTLEMALASPAYGLPEDVLDPADPYARREQTFPRLTDEQVARVVRFGTVEAVPAGRVLSSAASAGWTSSSSSKGRSRSTSTPPAGRGWCTGMPTTSSPASSTSSTNRQSLVGARMVRVGRVARVRRPQFRRMLAAEPDIAEVILRAFILRRVGLIEHEQGGAVLIGARPSADALRLERFMDRNGYPLRALDADAPAAREIMAAHGLDAAALPVVVLPQVGVLRNPSTAALAAALGLIEALDADEVFDLTVVGAAPPAWLPPSPAPRRGSTPSSSRPRRPAARPGPARRRRPAHRHRDRAPRGRALPGAGDLAQPPHRRRGDAGGGQHRPDARRGAQRRMAARLRRSRRQRLRPLRPRRRLRRRLGPTTSAFETSRPGVFAVGDVRAGSIKRVASAVGEGSIVIPAIHRILAGA
jgi:hypothetical protein